MREEEKREPGRRAMIVGLSAALLVLLAGCGKRGDLDPPPEAKDRKSRTYPKPQ